MNRADLIKDLFRQVSGFPDQESLYKEVQHFTGVEHMRSVKTWFTGDYSPTGQSLSSLNVFFTFIGCSIAEPIVSITQVFGLAQLVAFKVLTVEDVATLLGLVPDSVVRSLSGSRPLSLKKIEEASEIFELYRDQLSVEMDKYEKDSVVYKQLKQYLQKDSAITTVVGTETDKKANVPYEQITEAPKVNGNLTTIRGKKDEHLKSPKYAMFESLKHQIQAIAPLVAYIVSDECSAEERQLLRASVGQFAIFDLSNNLNRLCGEQARANLNGKKQ